MAIKIPVSADFDAGQLEQKIQQINKQFAAMGAAVAKASGQKFEPITLKSKQDLDYFTKQSQQLLKIQGELNKRMSNSGQGGKNPFEANWSKMYLNEKTRINKMREALVFMGAAFEDPHAKVSPASRPGSPGTPKAPPTPAPGAFGGIVSGAAQAGLRAAGPAGGVAAGALGTGMASGFGAGMMGLIGGIAALGVGKLVGMATEKIGQAEDNAVALDKLKRTLGDVNVSFAGLTTVVQGAGKDLKVTLDEAGRLANQFAKQGNLSGDQYGSLDGELRTGVGLSRSLGLDPAQGMSFLGTMRGMRQTQDEQGSRKMALLIGETIAKSNAFAKSDEVMDAISGYVTSQTRASLGANVGGYAGVFSALVGSGIPGLDPSGAGALLGRVNASLTAGGAKGEASQFFSNRIGARRGLNPFQMQLWREGGAFATLDDTFGAGSIGARAGLGGPRGSESFLQATMGDLRSTYGNSPGMLAQATANHLGISMRQAVALGSVGTNQLGELEAQLKRSGVSLSDMNAGGIASMSKAMFGTADERLGVASELWGRSGKDKLTDAESAKLDAVMRSGSEQEQKDILAQLIASRDQEMTQGKDIRDSKTAIENIKTLMADQLLPVTQAMRDGIMWMAGGGKKSSQEIREDLTTLDVNSKYKSLIEAQDKKIVEARMDELGGDGTPEDRQRRMDASRDIQEKANAEIARLEQEKAKVLAEELAKLRERKDEVVSPAGRSAPQGWRAVGGRARGASGGGSTGGRADSAPEAMRYFMNAGWSREQAAGIVANLTAESGLRHDAVGDGGMAYGVAQWHPDRQAEFRRWAGKDIRDSTREEQYAFVHYEMTEGLERPAGNRLRRAKTAREAGGVVSRYYERPKHVSHEAIKRGRMASELEGTPLPSGGSGGPGNDQRFIFDAAPIEVIHKNERGEPVRPSEMLATRVRPAVPFGADRGFA